MKKSTLLMMLSLVLAVAMGIGGTLAYLTDTDGQVNVMTVGNVQIKQNEQDRDGNQFVQDQQMLPIVTGAGTKDEAGYPVCDNYVDKIVTVTNTGSSDAYVRTLIAIPRYNYDGYDPANASTSVLHWNGYSAGDAAPDYPAATRIPGTETDVDNEWCWTAEDIYTSAGTVWPGNTSDWNMKVVKVNGVTYEVYVVTHLTAVKPGETTAPNLTGVYLDSNVDYDHDVPCYTMGGKEIQDLSADEPIKIPVLTQAVQAGGFDSPWDAFGAVNTFALTDENIINWITALDEDTVIVTLPADATDEDFKAAVTADAETIIVELQGDITYDVAAWAQNGLGGASTKSVTLDGNGHTITFNQTNSDWNNITTNGASLTIKNAHITNSGHNDGPWNRHDLNFACDVTMIDVTSDKAFAFKAGATLKNVTVSDANTSDTYAIWIQPNGQTVTLDNVTIDMLDCTDGRGIKIDEQYVSDPKKVTLNVSNTTFKTEEKSAILVKCAAGAEVNLNNVDIAGVAADTTNPVWVDIASASYADLVVVTGGSKIVEP